MSAKLYKNLALIFIYVKRYVENYAKICIGKCTPICKVTMAVVPQQFYPHFDIQFVKQNGILSLKTVG